MKTQELKLPTVVRLAKRLRDVKHEIGFAVLWDGSAYAHATVRADDGTVLAWDGWYPQEAPTGMKRVADLDFDNFDDMPSKLLLTANQPWLADELGYWLMPSYSPAVAAAVLVNIHFDDDLDARNYRQIGSADLVAYLPIVHREVFDSELRDDLARAVRSI